MKLKDYVTLGNLVCGFGSMVALIHGAFDLACYLFFAAYVFDVADGKVARWTGQHDAFGAYLDTACDFITNSVVSSLVAYSFFHFQVGYPWWLAGAIGSAPLVGGTIRQARSQARPRSVPCYWLGVPRPVAAFFVVALCNSSLISIGSSPWRQIGFVLAGVSVVVVSLLQLTDFPYANHNKRRWKGGMRFGMLWFLVGSPLSLLVGWLVLDWPGLFFDWVLGCLTGYIVFNWVGIPKGDLRRIRAHVETGEPAEMPLVHVDSGWRPRFFFSYLDPDDRRSDEGRSRVPRLP